MSDSPEIMYAAHTATCTFLLDSEGICRRIALLPNSKRSLPSSKGKDAARAAARCVNAQYVASLDPSVAGMLAEMPRVGASMLFARVDERGRVSLVRTGVVMRFEGHREDPFAGGMEPKPSESVATSAPVISPSSPPSPRRVRETSLPPPPPPPAESRTEQRSDRPQASAKQAIPKVSAAEFMRISDDSLDVDIDRTNAYDPQASSARRVTWPSPGINLSAPQPTLRQPTPIAAPEDEDREHDPYAAARGALPPPPRRSSEPPPAPPYLGRMRSIPRVTDPARPARTPSYPPLDKVAPARRRG